MRINSQSNRQPFITTDGIEFIEFTAPESKTLENALCSLGFTHIATHVHKDVELYRQNHINFIVNAEHRGQAGMHSLVHGPSSNAMAFRVPSVTEALDTAQRLDLQIVESTAGPMELNIPAIRTPEGSLIYLVDRYGAQSIYDIDFDFDRIGTHTPSGLLFKIDHVTKNVPKGTLNDHVEFYKRTFGFREIQSFQIKGKQTGLASIALTSPCGKIKLPINEPSDNKSQIEEFLRTHNGSGVQHIALSTPDIYQAVNRCTEWGTRFQSTPSCYYDDLPRREVPHYEDVHKLKELQILVDGSRESGVLLQIFTQDMVGPLFFEIIQRKGNQGFGEGNFQALFESIERDQVRRGYLDEVI